jgi:hypothetical protein
LEFCPGTVPNQAQEESIEFDNKIDFDKCLKALEIFEIRDALN